MDNRFKFVCRVCLVKDSTAVMRSLASQETRETLFECTSVAVTPGDKYPQQLCAKCWNQCWTWSNFKALAQDSDRELKTEVEEKKLMSEGDKVIVKEEKIVYLEGYSLAPEEQVLKLVNEDNELMCNNGDDHVLIELRLDNEEEDNMMAEAEVEIEKGNSLMGEGHKEEQFDYAYDGYERDTIEPSVGDAAKDGSEKEQTMREGPAKVKDRKHKCGYCSKGFSSSSNLKMHERVHTNERPFRCDECGDKFKEHGHLKAHKLIHSGVKTFECDQCDKKFRLKGDLMQHNLIHSGVRTFECEECGKNFRRNCDLANHKLIHAGIKLFECDDCEKKFTHNRDLKKHKLIHSGVKAFECDQCDKKFLRKSQLIQHKLTHSNKKLLKCIKCDIGFNHKWALTYHLMKKH